MCRLRVRTSSLGALPLLLLAVAASPAAEDDQLSPNVAGGFGGVPFTASCPTHSYLVGFQGRAGSDLDAVKPVCAELNADGSRGRLTDAEVVRDGQRVSGQLGGGGGEPFEGVCADTVRAPFVRELGAPQGALVGRIVYWCGPMTGPIRPRGEPGSTFLFGLGAARSLGDVRFGCPAGTLLAGIHGRAGEMVDAIGVICRRLEPVPGPATLSQAASSSAAVTAAARPAGPNPLANVRLQQPASTPVGTPAERLELADWLLCRGGDVYPTGRRGQVSDQPELEAHVFFIRLSKTPARADGSGLEPGTCGYADKVADVPYFVVNVDVGSATVPDLETYLKDASHYWSFAIRENAAIAMPEAVRHEQWTPPPATVAPSSTPIQGTARGSAAAREPVAVRARLPEDLYARNDSEVIALGFRDITVGDAKLEVEAQLDRLAEPTRAFVLCSVTRKGCESAATSAERAIGPPSAAPPSAPSSAPKLPAFLYGLREGSPDVLTSQHSGAANGDAGAWSLTQELPGKPGEYQSLIGAGSEKLYAVTSSDTLRYWHAGEFSVPGGEDRSLLVAGFAPSAYLQIAAAGGSVYGFAAGGAVDVFSNRNVDFGATTWQGPQRAADDWPAFSRVLSGGDGVFYTVRTDGALVWRSQYPGGTWSQSVVVGTGWGQFRELFTPGDGVIYAIQPNGDLLWHRFHGHYDGAAARGWDGPIKVADGWHGFKSVAATPAR